LVVTGFREANLFGRRVLSALHAYLVALGFCASAILAGLLLGGVRVGSGWVVLSLAVAAAVAERGTLRLSRTIEVSVALLPLLLAAVLFGPLASMLVGGASMLADLRPARGTPSPYLKFAIYFASRSITGAATGAVAAFFAQRSGNLTANIVMATVASALTAPCLDLLFASITVRLRGSGRLLDGARLLGPVLVSAVLLYAPVVALLAYTYKVVSPWVLPLFFAPALAAHRLFSLYQAQLRLTDDLIEVNDRLGRANLSFASALVATLDARDQYTAGHSAAVAIYSRDIAARMGLSKVEQELAHLCGLVHDIGKIGLPPGLLEKTGPLTLEERRLMQQHSQIGERILAKVEDYAEIAAIVRHHHERVDGNGYPDGLSDDEIPLLSKIVAVADAYNAMTSDRPYRDAMPSRVARLRLAQAVESQFDTSVVAAFEALLAGATEAYRSGRRADFNFREQEEAPQAVAMAHAV
jgi:putative nucleotidyltransferase with HDIG domain